MQHQKVRVRAIHLPEAHGKAILLRADQAEAEVQAIVHQARHLIGDLHLPREDRAVVGDRVVPGHPGARAVVQKVQEAVKRQNR